MTQPTPDARAIDRAGKLLIGPLLGVGGMAEVYRGWLVGDQGFHRDVAVKRVLATYSENADFLAMFTNEARLASLLHHPNIVAVLDLDRDVEGRIYQVLEFIDGCDLDKLASVGTVPLPIVLYVMEKVLRGLDCAHTASNPTTGRPLGIVHRDCTPSNVLIDRKGHVRVSDFGVAKAVLATNATQSGTAKGKPSYMSPEQLHGAADLDARADLFAVGAMMWELFAGYRPFVGTTVLEVMSKVMDYGRGFYQIPPIGSVNPGVPYEVAQLVSELLAADRNHRPASAAHVVERLVPWVPPNGPDLLARLMAERFPPEPVGPDKRATVVARPAPPTSAPQPTPSGLGQIAQAATGFPVAVQTAPRPRRRWPLAALGAGLVAAGVVAGVMLVGRDGQASSAAPAPPTVSADAAPAIVVLPVDAGMEPMAGSVDAPPDMDAAQPLDATPPMDAAIEKRPRPRPHSSGGTSSGGVIEVNLEGKSPQ